MIKNTIPHNIDTLCSHCGEYCLDDEIQQEAQVFCCIGCQTVYNLLNAAQLTHFYDLKETSIPFSKPKAIEDYAYLDDEEICTQLLDFQDDQYGKITLHCPQIHCTACMWLLENLHRLDSGVQRSTVNFLKKEVSILFIQENSSVRKVVELLATLGYS
ncbi:MAG: heavy metal translocating P-type ATPase metal-binding domain-containing protein, partial [Saprospiraceae bacterium]